MYVNLFSVTEIVSHVTTNLKSGTRDYIIHINRVKHFYYKFSITNEINILNISVHFARVS